LPQIDPGSVRRSGIGVLFFGREPNNSGTRKFAQANPVIVARSTLFKTCTRDYVAKERTFELAQPRQSY